MRKTHICLERFSPGYTKFHSYSMKTSPLYHHGAGIAAWGNFRCSSTQLMELARWFSHPKYTAGDPLILTFIPRLKKNDHEVTHDFMFDLFWVFVGFSMGFFQISRDFPWVFHGFSGFPHVFPTVFPTFSATAPGPHGLGPSPRCSPNKRRHPPRCSRCPLVTLRSGEIY